MGLVIVLITCIFVSIILKTDLNYHTAVQIISCLRCTNVHNKYKYKCKIHKILFVIYSLFIVMGTDGVCSNFRKLINNASFNIYKNVHRRYFGIKTIAVIK